MDDENFIQIEEELRRLCTTIGAPELTEDRFYRARDGIEGTEYLKPPRMRVLAQLDALDRFFSLYDGTVYRRAMEKIESLLQEDYSSEVARPNIPSHAIVLFSNRTEATDEEFDLRELPDMTELRKQLAELRRELSES